MISITTRNSSPLRVYFFSAVVFISAMSFLIFGMVSTAHAAALYRQLQLGMSGADVSDLQRFLATDTSVYPSGLVTGYFGPLTQAAVIKFQTKNGIDTAGRVGPITLAAINAQMGLSTVGDSNAPSIYGLTVGTSGSSASLNWSTNEGAVAVVYYSTSPISMKESSPTSMVEIGGTSQLVHTDLRAVHGATITGLMPNTTYFYVVYAKDGSNNESITWPSTFRTSN